jgi:hypothetical protein
MHGNLGVMNENERSPSREELLAQIDALRASVKSSYMLNRTMHKAIINNLGLYTNAFTIRTTEYLEIVAEFALGTIIGISLVGMSFASKKAYTWFVPMPEDDLLINILGWFEMATIVLTCIYLFITTFLNLRRMVIIKVMVDEATIEQERKRWHERNKSDETSL